MGRNELNILWRGRGIEMSYERALEGSWRVYFRQSRWYCNYLQTKSSV